MLQRILCPNPKHIEKTPSFVIYPSGVGHCFGCGYRVFSSKIRDICLERGLSAKPPENLREKFKYIHALPKTLIRGLYLPTDSVSYYVCWPRDTYYKRRFFNEHAGAKYVGAQGHEKPLFLLKKECKKNLFIIEGEINALSLEQAYPSVTIASPGGCGDFTSNKQDVYLHYYLSFSNIIVIMDSDNASRASMTKFVGKLKSRQTACKIQPVIVDMDANDILQAHGVSKLKDEFKRYMDV